MAGRSGTPACTEADAGHGRSGNGIAGVPMRGGGGGNEEGRCAKGEGGVPIVGRGAPTLVEGRTNGAGIPPPYVGREGAAGIPPGSVVGRTGDAGPAGAPCVVAAASAGVCRVGGAGASTTGSLRAGVGDADGGAGDLSAGLATDAAGRTSVAGMAGVTAGGTRRDE